MALVTLRTNGRGLPPLGNISQTRNELDFNPQSGGLHSTIRKAPNIWHKTDQLVTLTVCKKKLSQTSHTLLISVLNDVINAVSKAHIHHTVHFIKYDILEIIQIQYLFIEKILNPSWSPTYYVYPSPDACLCKKRV